MNDTFQTLIDDIRAARGWSVRQMAEVLGYSSATSIVRLAQEKANHESIERFGRVLHAMTEAPLSEEEGIRLDALLERSQLSDEEYRTMQLLRSLMRNDTVSPQPITLVSSLRNEQTDIITRYRDKKDLRVAVFNCARVPIFPILAELNRINPVEIDHFLLLEGPAYLVVEYFLAVTPVLFAANYHPYSRLAEFGQPMGLLRSDIVFFIWQEDGRPVFDLVTFLSPDVGFVAHYPVTDDSLLPPSSLKDNENLGFRPARLVGMDADEDFAAYCSYCADLERDRTVMRVKPDFGVDQIPVHILTDAARDGCPDHALVETILPSLIDLFSQREQNARTKHQPQYHVLNLQAVWHFVKTGQLSDHPWLLRAFTPAERREILLSVIGQMTHNPRYHLRLTRSADISVENELIFYEGVGLSVVKAHTDYQLSGSHAEIMISQPAFLQLYQQFFLNSIMRYQTLSEERTLAALREMVQYLDDHFGAPSA